MSTEKHNYNGLLVDIATVFIASCALVLSLVEGCQSRKHNRLMVKPAISLSMSLVDDQAGRGLFLMNKGVGPAIVNDVKIFVDGVPIETENDYWNVVCNKLGLIGPEFSGLIVCYVVNGSFLAPGEKTAFFVMQDKGLSEQNFQKFLKGLQKIDVRVTYKSVYDEVFEFVLKKDALNKVLEKMCN